MTCQDTTPTPTSSDLRPLRTWLCWDESGYKVECSGKTVEEAATEYCDEHERTKKSYQVEVHCRLLNERGHGTDDYERITVTIDPEVPNCHERTDSKTKRDDDGHDWRSPKWLGGDDRNPGVWANAGGLRIKQVCRCCGAYKMTDTWDTNHCGQPFESVCYSEADDESLVYLAGVWGGDA